MTDVPLAESASRGAAVTLGAQLVRIGIQVAGIVVLARLVTPEQFGLVAMILAIIGIGEVLRDFGLSQAAVQARDLSAGQQSNLFWANTGIGLALTTATVGASWVIAAFYGQPELQPLTVALASTFVLRGMSTQFTAHLARDLRFGRLSTAEISGQLIGLVGGVVLALLGFGAWALVGQQVLQAAATLVATAAVSGWMPGWVDRSASIRPFVTYGAGLAGTQLLDYASKNIGSVVIGARFGATALGFYNRAFQLMMLPLLQVNAPATRVAVPVLSRLQDQKSRFAQFVLAGQFATLLAVGAITSVCISQADAVVRLFLGPQWLPAAPLFRILAIGGLFQAASYATYWVFLAKGLTKQNFAYALVARPVVIACILVGSMWGVEGVAWGYSISLACMWPLGLLWLSRVSDAPTAGMLRNGALCMTILAVATAAAWGAASYLPTTSVLLRILVGVAVTAAVIALAAFVLPAFRRPTREVLALRRHFRRSQRTRASA